LLKPNGEMLIVLDDTILNGATCLNIREWLLDKFVIIGIHSLPFNSFFKAKANIKTSVLHVRKKSDENDMQGHVFMSISNNIGHDNSLRDTPFRNSLTEILMAYLEWQRAGNMNATMRNTVIPSEKLEGPLQYWLTAATDITTERFDAFFYCPDLHGVYKSMEEASCRNKIDILDANSLELRSKLTSMEKKDMKASGKTYRYIEIGDVTRYGLITKYVDGPFDELPSRGEYMIRSGDILVAVNNSSRGTVVRVPNDFDNAICTSGFIVIVPKDEETGLLLWYALRSEICRKQIYYLAQTASQPELKIEAWNKYFKIPIPIGEEKNSAIEKASKFFEHIDELSDVNNWRFDLTD
ncbi:MAG: restriction endonuclease subunit S, partial [Methanomassiliicoccaceae archaeon]|nr:restriction endonuclease subunit S [Methanomassiliicoccaceae archaeon]